MTRGHPIGYSGGDRGPPAVAIAVAAGLARPPTVEPGTIMDLARFTDLVERHGGDPARWPEDRRAEALAFLATDEAARALVEADLELGRRLTADAPPRAPAGLLDRILDRAFAEDPGGSATERDDHGG